MKTHYSENCWGDCNIRSQADGMELNVMLTTMAVRSGRNDT